MRLRIVPLPQQEYAHPYLLVMDRVHGDMAEGAAESLKGINSNLKEQTGGLCHGFLMVEGELEIE